jgi:hypothetical protein
LCKRWQSFIPPNPNFLLSSWMVASNIARLNNNVTTVARPISSDNVTDKNAQPGPTICTTRTSGSAFDVAPQDLINTAGSGKQLFDSLFRLFKRGLNEYDIVLTIRDLIREKGRDNSVLCRLRQRKQPLTTNILFPQFSTFAAVRSSCLQSIGRVICFDFLHWMHYEPIAFLANHLKACLKCDFSAVVCPNTIPFATHAPDSGILVFRCRQDVYRRSGCRRTGCDT